MNIFKPRDILMFGNSHKIDNYYFNFLLETVKN